MTRSISARLAVALVSAFGMLAFDMAAPAPAEARARKGECSVFKGNRKIDQNSCLAREICYFNEKTRGETCRTEYLWPTNATTLVTYEGGRPKLVNGAPAKVRNIMGRSCALNTVTGNTFCYRAR